MLPPALIVPTITLVEALVVVLFPALNQVEGNLNQPPGIDRQARLYHAAILASLLVVGALLRPVDLLLAVPAAILVMPLSKHVYLREEPGGEGDSAVLPGYPGRTAETESGGGFSWA